MEGIAQTHSYIMNYARHPAHTHTQHTHGNTFSPINNSNQTQPNKYQKKKEEEQKKLRKSQGLRGRESEAADLMNYRSKSELKYN